MSSGARGTSSSNRPGVTLVEILVVSGLLAGVLAAFYFFFLGMKSGDERIGREQEFAQLQARLTLALREDLRTAVDLDRTGDGRWTLRRLVVPEAGAAVEPETVAWTFSPERNVITREGKDRRDYDFSKLLPAGKRIRFELR